MVIVARIRGLKDSIQPLVFLVFLLILHTLLLSVIRFEDWPEMILYPWFLTKGLLYYRDVILMYPPGAYFLLLPFYAVAGFSVFSERIFGLMLAVVGDIALFIVAYRIFGRAVLAAAITSFYILWHILFGGNTVWYEQIMTPLYISAFYWLYSYIEERDSRVLFSAGSLIALATLVKQTAFIMLAVSVLLVIAVNRRRFMQAVGHSLILITPAAVLVAVVLVIATILGIGNEYLYWVYVFPVSVNSAGSGYLLLPSLGDLLYMLPAFLPVFALALVFMYMSRHRRGFEAPFLIALTTVMFTAGLTRFSLHKVMPALPFSALSAGMATEYYARMKQPRISVWGVLAVIVILLFAGQLRSVWKFFSSRNAEKTEFFGTRYAEVGEFIRTRIGNQPFFIFGDYDYEYLYVNRRPTVLPWTPMFPWNWQVAGVQDRIISSLESGHVPYVLYIPYHPDKPLYDGMQPAKLTGYITSKYSLQEPIPGGGMLLKRNFGVPEVQ